ncbi:hypothetical protein HELRODRAFT_68342 [Helobdella robusta]|uniref:Uncharacterized protein n=1 Tax=Helobdella robusta TaxID=6412 RepID=T1FZD3_HELRO|nr:hypothetical protein HELRODRAFT_68342 [Helobdella robusta]ESN96361.1 hypothetical protein HELRODRAFT_68342 [Helobdella robusta]
MVFHAIDYAIFALMLIFSLIIGLYHAFSGGKQKTPKEYLVGNRSMSTLPVALSMLVSFLSGIVVLGTPAEMYTKGTQLFMRTIGYTLACIISSLFIVPLFFNLKVTSSFEYLETRFHSKVTRLLGSISFLIGNVFYMGLLLYTPATAMQASTGLNIYVSILAIGIIGTVYTTLGGLRGVVWVDTLQAIIMLGGMLFIVVQGILLVGGFKQMWTINESGGRIIFFNFNPDPTQRLSFWSTIIGGCFSTLTIFGVGQVSVQRYCSLPTLSKARLSVLLNIPMIICMNVLTSLVGLVVFAYYANLGCDPVRSKQVENVNQLVPYFMVNVLNYPGLPGAFLAVLFSGALSSISSSLNSCAAVTWQDLVSYFFKNKTEHTKAFIIKVLVVLFGLLALGVAFLARLVGQHVLQASLSFSGATMGPSLGMFLLGGIFPFANARGAVSGCVVASIISLWLSIGAFVTKPHMQTLPTSIDRCLEYNISSASIMMTTTSVIMNNHVTAVELMYEVSFLWYSAIGCLLTIIIGVVVSLIFSTLGSYCCIHFFLIIFVCSVAIFSKFYFLRIFCVFLYARVI